MRSMCYCANCALFNTRSFPSLRKKQDLPKTSTMVECRKVLLALLLAVSTTVLIELGEDKIASVPSKYMPRYRKRSKIRPRVRFEKVTMHLSDGEFQRAFRLSRRAFNKLLILLLPELRRDDIQACKSSSG